MVKLTIIYIMDMVYTIQKPTEHLKEFGKKGGQMDLELVLIRMETDIQVFILMIKELEKELMST